jgi:hypothetical protein
MPLPLSERTYRCGCGLVTGRDVNAAVNLLNLAASGAESLNACGATIRPGLAGHVPVKQEPGAAHADQTGTASGQPLAAEQKLFHAHRTATADMLTRVRPVTATHMPSTWNALSRSRNRTKPTASGITG